MGQMAGPPRAGDLTANMLKTQRRGNVYVDYLRNVRGANAIPVAEQVARGDVERGVVLCATGIGASIAANKVNGVRAAVVTSDETARLTRQDNDSNVLAVGGRTTANPEDAARWLRIWLETPFAGAATSGA